MRFFLIVFLLAASSTSVVAAPIIYTYSGRFSGSIGNTSFSSQQTTIIGVGNTEDVIVTYGGGLITSPLSALYITVASIGTGSFLGYNNLVYTDLGPNLGVNGSTPSSANDFLGSEYGLGANYDPKTNLGPLPVTFRTGGSGVAETTIGHLIFSGATSEVTFTASVPEPTSIALLTLSVLGALGPRLRKALR